MWKPVLAVVLLCTSLAHCRPTLLPDTYPQQIHIAYGESPTTMVVTWATYAPVNDSIVRYCICTANPCAPTCQLTFQARGIATKFVDGDTEKREEWFYRAWLTGLKPGQTYGYICGGGGQWSNFYEFEAMPVDPNWKPRFAVYGDLGIENAQSLPRLLDDVNKGMYDAVLHVGDMCYDMYENQSYKGDAFMNLIQPIASGLPYMVCVGNHEEKYNFSNFVERFTMPNGVQNLFYSFDIGPAHIIAMSTELLFFLNYGIDQIKHQYEWLERDLMLASSKENRTKHPWIITMGHRPMYCTNVGFGDCVWGSYLVRDGLPVIAPFSLEQLFYKYGVDLSFWAHEHSYERLWPVYQNKIYNGSYDHPYTNPTAPVHIVTGSAGNREKLDSFGPWMPYSAFRDADYGYGRMTIHNATHLYFEQVSDDKSGTVIDKVWLIKDTHGPYPPR